jgi:hypothetical protein
MLGVRCCEGPVGIQDASKFSKFSESIKTILPSKDESDYLASKKVVMNEVMASCHAITHV